MIYKIILTPAFVKDYSLCNQIRRSSISIMANIAEGFGRKSRKEFSNFLNIAHGSAAEVQSHLYVAQDLDYINPNDFKILYEKVDEVSKIIQGLMKYLRNS